MVLSRVVRGNYAYEKVRHEEKRGVGIYGRHGKERRPSDFR
jgi:hypothetical protein